MGSHQRAAPSPDVCEARATGVTKDSGSDPDHLGGNTRAPPPLATSSLPPETEAAEGAPHLPFGEAPRVHTEAAEDVLGEGKSDYGSGKAETMGTDVKKLDSSQGSAPENVIETGNKGK